MKDGEVISVDEGRLDQSTTDGGSQFLRDLYGAMATAQADNSSRHCRLPQGAPEGAGHKRAGRAYEANPIGQSDS